MKKKDREKSQTQINFAPSGSDVVQPAFSSTKFDMAKMRKATTHWILMH